MKGDDNRDRAIEQMLRETRRETAASQSCVDAEALAAWSDGTLTPAEVRRTETHAAACDRCQSMLAAFARAEPALPAIAEPFWQRWRLQWLAPAAAMATALAIWVAVPGDRPLPATPAPAAVEERPTISGPRPRAEVEGTVDRTAPSGAPVVPAPSEAQPRASDAAALRQRSQPSDQTSDRERSSNASGLARSPSGSAPRRKPEESAAAKKEMAVAPVTPAPAIGAIAPPGNSAARGMSEPAAAGGAVQGALPAPAAVPPPPAQVSPPATADARAAAPPIRAFSRMDARSAPVPIDVVSPDAVHRWRIDASGRLQHSSSSGATWQPVTLTAPDVPIAAVSPEGSVCWLVGRNGAVWVTADGLRFDRRPVPAQVDLVSVGATDARHARVVAADGRTFVTSDRGVTWTPAAP